MDRVRTLARYTALHCTAGSEISKFLWLVTGMKILIFGTYDFFGSGNFMDRKMAGCKKVVLFKNEFFHANQPHDDEVFVGLILTIICWNY